MPSFDLAVIDLDNTLYCAASGVFSRMDERMTEYVAEKIGVDHATADEMRRTYWRQYGTTLHGLMLHHGMEPEPFLHYVHDIDIHAMLRPDSSLERALSRMPCNKVIHTNGTREHAERVLSALGIEHHFSRIYDIRFNGYLPKPNRETLDHLLRSEGAEKARTLVVDDMPNNLVVASQLGCSTALIGKDASAHRFDFHAEHFSQLPDLMSNPKRIDEVTPIF